MPVLPLAAATKCPTSGSRREGRARSSAYRRDRKKDHQRRGPISLRLPQIEHVPRVRAIGHVLVVGLLRSMGCDVKSGDWEHIFESSWLPFCGGLRCAWARLPTSVAFRTAQPQAESVVGEKPERVPKLAVVARSSGQVAFKIGGQYSNGWQE